jgi:hypothetical protein
VLRGINCPPPNAGLNSERLWQIYFLLGGSLEPEPDTQSPFFDPLEPSARIANERPGMRVLSPDLKSQADEANNNSTVLCNPLRRELFAVS